MGSLCAKAGLDSLASSSAKTMKRIRMNSTSWVSG
jgi:hypothetical protein